MPNPSPAPITPEVRDLLAIIRTEADAIRYIDSLDGDALGFLAEALAGDLPACAATILAAAERLADALGALDLAPRVTHHNGRLTDRYTASARLDADTLAVTR